MRVTLRRLQDTGDRAPNRRTRQVTFKLVGRRQLEMTFWLYGAKAGPHFGNGDLMPFSLEKKMGVLVSACFQHIEGLVKIFTNTFGFVGVSTNHHGN